MVSTTREDIAESLTHRRCYSSVRANLSYSEERFFYIHYRSQISSALDISLCAAACFLWTRASDAMTSVVKIHVVYGRNRFFPG